MLPELMPLISIAVTAVSVVGFIWTIKSAVAVLDARLSAQDRIIEAIQRDLQTLNKIVIDLAVQNQRLVTIEDRVLTQGKRLDEGLGRFNRWIDNKVQ
jgi:hypothetical protein